MVVFEMEERSLTREQADGMLMCVVDKEGFKITTKQDDRTFWTVNFPYNTTCARLYLNDWIGYSIMDVPLSSIKIEYDSYITIGDMQIDIEQEGGE